MTDIPDTSSAFALSPSGERVYWTSMPIHRLVAVSEYGFDAVANYNVSHKNEIPFDNRPENIEIVDYVEIAENQYEEYKNKKYWNEDWLQFQIEEKDRSVADIAEECDVSKATIHLHIRKNDIEYTHLEPPTGDPFKDRKYKDQEWLRREKKEKVRAIPDIAEECDVTPNTIRRHLEEFGIGTKPEYQKKSWLKERKEEGMSVEKIAQETPVRADTIRKWLERNGLSQKSVDAGLMDSFNVS